MHVEKIKFVNYGPIKNLNIDCKIGKNGKPVPLILVGPNGAGKSYVIAQIVNAILIAQSQLYRNSELEKGKVYKARGGSQILYNSPFSISEVNFTNNWFITEMNLRDIKSNLPKDVLGKYEYNFWNNVPDNEKSHFEHNFGTRVNELREEFETNSFLVFPPDRFEAPIWLNEENLNFKITPHFGPLISDQYNRSILSHSPMKNLQNWLFDLIFEKYTRETNVIPPFLFSNQGKHSRRRNNNYLVDQ